MQFNIGQHFSGSGSITPSVTLMRYPYLIDSAFNERTDQFQPQALLIVLKAYVRILMEHYGADAGKKILGSLSIATDTSDSPNGFFGFDGLGALRFSSDPKESQQVVIGVDRARLTLARFGNCLGLRPRDVSGMTHEHAEKILQEILRAPEGSMFIRPFVQRYGFSMRPDLVSKDGNHVLNVTREFGIVRRYLPDIDWCKVTESLGMALAEDFEKGDVTAGVVVGQYGDAEIRCRIVCKNSPDDPNWRRGFLRRLQGTVMSFEHGSYCPEVEYFVQVAFPWHAPDECSVNYWHEQCLMSSVVRMLYAGLYQRSFQRTVENGNPDVIKFRGQKEADAQI